MIAGFVNPSQYLQEFVESTKLHKSQPTLMLSGDQLLAIGLVPDWPALNAFKLLQGIGSPDVDFGAFGFSGKRSLPHRRGSAQPISAKVRPVAATRLCSRLLLGKSRTFGRGNGKHAQALALWHLPIHPICSFPTHLFDQTLLALQRRSTSHGTW